MCVVRELVAICSSRSHASVSFNLILNLWGLTVATNTFLAIVNSCISDVTVRDLDNFYYIYTRQDFLNVHFILY